MLADVGVSLQRSCSRQSSLPVPRGRSAALRAQPAGGPHDPLALGPALVQGAEGRRMPYAVLTAHAHGGEAQAI